MLGAVVVRRDPEGAPRRAATVRACEHCGKPAGGYGLDQGWAALCRRCANAIYGVKD